MSILQMVDFKGYVFGCSERIRAENVSIAVRKAGASSRTPNGVFYSVNYTEGIKRVKENFGKWDVGRAVV
jgi:hypothetical protein